MDPAHILEDAPALSKAILPPHQGLLFMLLESLPHAVSGNTRDDRGCLKRYSKKEQKQSTAAVSIGRVVFLQGRNTFHSVLERLCYNEN